MRLHEDYRNLPEAARGAVLAIGNFDGVHLGHRALIAEASATAVRLGAPLAVITFEPHPREFFQPEGAPFRLTLLPEKLGLLEALGVDQVFVLPFNKELSALSGDDFVRRVLRESLGARHVVVGEGFSFGRGRSGSAETLKSAAAEGLFGLTLMPPVACKKGEIISSTSIRDHIRRADFGPAEALLGRPWEIAAEVVHGEKRGRAIGYPTANQDISRYVCMPYGIYAVQVSIEGEGRVLGGVASFGIRPMFRVEKPILETYIFDFDRDIYGKNLHIRPVKYLREERDFSDISQLKEQIGRDCAAARAALPE